MPTRVRLHLAGIATCLVVIGFFTAALVSAEPSTTRPATPYEAVSCAANDDKPVTGDCTVVPLAGYVTPDGTILDGRLFEDDPFGRWDCRTMGNRTCGDGAGNLTIWFELDGNLAGFDINDPHRPACFMEPSNTPDGWEIIGYSRMSGRGAPEYIGDPLGFEVRCPTRFFS